MLHVGALHQASEVEPSSGWRGEVGGRLGGKVGVDERSQVGLVGEERRPGRSSATSQWVAVVLRYPVTAEIRVSRFTGTVGLCSYRVPDVSLLPTATAAALS